MPPCSSIRTARRRSPTASCTVLRSTHLRDDLRRRGLERVKAYSWARSVKRVREIYGEVLWRS